MNRKQIKNVSIFERDFVAEGKFVSWALTVLRIEKMDGEEEFDAATTGFVRNKT